MSTATFVLIAAIIAVAVLLLTRRPSISALEARRLVGEGARLVDVRTPDEFAAGHLDGAINLPVQDIVRRADELGPKDTPIVLYCQSGARSGVAVRLLGSHGFRQVSNLGAMSRWRG